MKGYGTDHDHEPWEGHIGEHQPRTYRAAPENRQGSANPWACKCGYEGSSDQDLTGHCIAMAPLDPEGTHGPVSGGGSQ